MKRLFCFLGYKGVVFQRFALIDAIDFRCSEE
jgi:hypothetical protein